MLDDFQPGEQHRQEGGDQLFHRQEAHHIRCALPAGQLHKTVDVVGHLDSGEVLAAVVGVFDRDGQVQTQAADERERMCGVDRQRREYREHLFVEVRRQPPALGLVEFGPRHDDDALRRERRTDRVEEHLGVPAGDLLGALADAAQLFAR